MAKPSTSESYFVCSVVGCQNATTRNRLMTFFRLPARIPRRRDWLRLMGREDLLTCKSWAKHRICEVHFKPQLFQTEINTPQKILKKFALPTLCMPVSAVEDKGTDPYLPAADVSIPTDQPSTSKADSTSQTIKKEDDDMKAKSLRFQILCDKFLSKEMSARVKAQMIDVRFDGESSSQLQVEYDPPLKRIKLEKDDDVDIKDVFVKTETFFTY